MIDISIDGVDGVVVNLRSLADRTVPSIVRGLNYAIGGARDVMVAAIAADIGLEPDKVRKQLPIRNATTRELSATLSATRKRIPLIEFHAQGPVPSRGRGDGVSYQLRGGRGRVPNAFLATMKTGHKGVFARKGKSRLPIRELFGPSLGHVFAVHRQEGLARAQEAFHNSFASDIASTGGLSVS